MNLYEITTDYIEKMQLLDNGINANDGTLIDDDITTQELENIKNEIAKDITEKTKNIYAVFIKYNDEIDILDKEIKRLTELKQKKSKSLSNFKEYVIGAMQTLEKAKLQTDIGNISIRTSKAVSVDETLLDKKYFKEKITVAVDKELIREKLKNNEIVKGAKFITNYSLSFK